MPALLCRYKDRLEAIYAQHEERQKERVRAIKTQAGQASMSERVKQVLPHPGFAIPHASSACLRQVFDKIAAVLVWSV